MSTTRLCLVYLAVVLAYCDASKILVLFSMPSRSHANLGDGVVRHLLNDGHEVTFICPFPYKSSAPGFRWVNVSSNLDALPTDMMTIEKIMNKQFYVDDHGMLMYMMTELTKSTIENENVQKILNDPKEQFDVVISEWMFSELPVGFGAVFNCPFIWVSSMDVHWAVLRLIDQPSNPAYSGDTMTPTLPPYDFVQRVKELYNQIKVQYIRYSFFDGLESESYEKLLAPIVVKRGRQPPSFFDIQFNASLVLANSHVSLGQSIALPQNYKAVGGYHIQEDVKPLPDDLKKLMDNAKNGVIYFSMGSNLKSKDIPKEIKEGLLKIFGELKQTVLWKFEEDLPNAPKNLHILKWAPQPSILSHPNTILFITHGGLLSTTEAIHFGVPIIGIPVFADQFINVARAVHKGYALKVDLSYTMAGELKKAIEEVTANPRYGQKAKALSFIYHDRPTTPGKELAHWVKHVIQTGGALHLRSPALTVPFYQKLYLDLLAIILVIVFSVISLLKLTCAKLCSKKKTGNKKKTN